MQIAFVYPVFLWLLLLLPVLAAVAFLNNPSKTFRFWAGLILRSIIALSLILALAGVQLRIPNDTLSVVFLLDVSDSIQPDEQEYGEGLIAQAIEEMPDGDRAAIVVFGKNALVERLASEEQRLAEITSAPVTTRTDIASALQLAMALFPGESAKRVVLLSDGRENLSQAVEQAELASMQNIELRYVPLGVSSEGGQEVRLDSFDVPANVYLGAEFNLDINVVSSTQTGATLYVFGDDTLIQTQELTLQKGENRFQVPVKASEVGFKRFRAQIVPDVDQYLQNNESSAFTIVNGPPQVLLVEGSAEDGENLAAALQSAEMDISRIDPSQFPATLAELVAYDAVILANVPAASLPTTAMDILPTYVRDLGKGLLMVGGEESFGAGGYLRSELEKALPVDMDVKSKERNANLALVLVVDKSGSMGRCHCDNPDLFQTYTPTETGQAKVEIAKEAIMRAASAVGGQDYLGVLTFDSAATWQLNLSQLVDYYTLEQSIGAFQAKGETNMAAGVIEAYEALENVDAKYKHVILLTDGWETTGDLTKLVQEKYDEGITLSIVAAGGGSALYLESLAKIGGGQYYAATDMLSVPDIFLKETVQSVGQYIIEEPFYPLAAGYTPILSGIDESALPALLGYNGTSIKQTARINLVTPRGDPLLATWQFGLGRSAVWTSDLKGKWATDWVQWDAFSRFSAQLVEWLLPLPQPEGFTASASLEEDRIALQLDARTSQGDSMNFLDVKATVVDPELKSQEVSLLQTGFGRYEASMDAEQPGTYLVQIQASQDNLEVGGMTLGVSVPYSPEYKEAGTNRSLLAELARLTGGAELTQPELAFEHSLARSAYAREIWAPLLLIAALLFVFDVAVRRVVLRRDDFVRAGEWVREKISFRRFAGIGEPKVFNQLFAARDRVRTRRGASAARGEIPQVDLSSAPAVKPEMVQVPMPEKTAKPAVSQEEAMERLRTAKKRARKE